MLLCRLHLGFGKSADFAFSGKGAYWTKIHPPNKLVDVYYDVTYAKEDRVTEQYFEWFGKDKVRGGRYVGADFDASLNRKFAE